MKKKQSLNDPNPSGSLSFQAQTIMIYCTAWDSRRQPQWPFFEVRAVSRGRSKTMTSSIYEDVSCRTGFPSELWRWQWSLLSSLGYSCVLKTMRAYCLSKTARAFVQKIWRFSDIGSQCLEGTSVDYKKNGPQKLEFMSTLLRHSNASATSDDQDYESRVYQNRFIDQ